MGKQYYKPKTNIVEAVQLTWDNWNDICDMLGDLMGTDKIHGVAVTDENVVRENPDSEAHRIGLWIPAKPSAYVATEGDYIIKDIGGHVGVLKKNVFESQYDKVEA